MTINARGGGRFFVAEVLLNHMKLFTGSQHRTNVGVMQVKEDNNVKHNITELVSILDKHREGFL